ncbi:MAG: helix-turn-helix transcriptional regulator [Ruminococcus flavefaciens]|nr:helix-turn-helix transcriptional regulator [Ruminococcus flavefaciens]
MKINYIVKEFDKDFYNFDAVVVPVQQSKSGITGPYYYDKAWHDDTEQKLKQLKDFEFEFGKSEAVYSEVTGVYYIFVCARDWSRKLDRKNNKEWLKTYHEICFNSIFECIKQLDVQSILIQPLLFGYNNINEEGEVYKLLEELYTQNAELSNKKIYAIVNDLIVVNRKHSLAIYNLKSNRITKEEFKKEMIAMQMEQNRSYLCELRKKAEIETVYPEKSKVQQAYSELRQSSYFFDEYLNRYQGTASELAENAGIDKSTLSKIKSHTYKAKSKNVIIALAIALDLTVKEREKFINSAGFSYPITEHDRFIEQQLRKKRYNKVVDFNKDIMDKYPDFAIEARSSGGYKSKKSDE